ncbi:MAG: hypothetical protein QG557_267 [Pseudomonadota bacterium]|nr:hypothetical protein [Pseudomonadota bacterium]
MTGDVMKTLYKEILIGLMFIFGIAGIAGIVLGEFVLSLILFVTADILRSSKLYTVKNVA